MTLADRHGLTDHITVEALSAAGGAARRATSTPDLVDRGVTATCLPDSTIVPCSATYARGNTATCWIHDHGA